MMRPFLLSVLLLMLLVVEIRVHAVRVLPKSQQEAATTILSAVNPRHRELLSNVDVPFPASPDEHLVASMPLLDPASFSTRHWAGLLPASGQGDKFLFYWLFAPDLTQSMSLDEASVPLVIWLNGGPGCSSMDGLFLENGPFRFQGAEEGHPQLVPAEFSWHKAPAYTIYIDQPVGTGLSFTTSRKYPGNDHEVNIDFYYFLQSFLKLHADKFVTDGKFNRPLYFSGESHAGHYIPSMMAYILQQNQQLQQGNVYIPLSGAAIGNGWTDPYVQYAAAKAAYGHGIIDRAQMAALDEKEKQCQAMLDRKSYSNSICFELLDEIVEQSYGTKSPYKVSQYDIRKVESQRGSRTFPPGHKTVEAYLGGGPAVSMPAGTTQEALQAVHATYSGQAGQTYMECTDPPYNALSHQDGLGVVPDVVKILEHSIEGEDPVRLLFFNGVTDLICNHVGNEILLERLPWQHQNEWTQAERVAWKAPSSNNNDGHISGYMKEFNNLLFLKILDSGHMVPMDLPDVALDMLVVFMFGGPDGFKFSPQNLQRAEESALNGGSCPTCPACPVVNDTHALMSAGEEKGGLGAVVISDRRVWAAVVLAVVVLIVIFFVMRRRRSSRYASRSPVAAYDLEMRDGTYFDNPSDSPPRPKANGTVSFRRGSSDEEEVIGGATLT